MQTKEDPSVLLFSRVSRNRAIGYQLNRDISSSYLLRVLIVSRGLACCVSVCLRVCFAYFTFACECVNAPMRHVDEKYCNCISRRYDRFSILFYQRYKPSKNNSRVRIIFALFFSPVYLIFYPH